VESDSATVEVDSALGEAVSVAMESYTVTVEADLVLGKSDSTESVAEESESAATEAIHERASQPCPGLRRRGFSYLGSQARASLPDKPAKRRTTKQLALPGEASRAANKGSKHALCYFFASQ